ncbi:leucine-rich repeat domain-containing protein [Clostridium perfringens]|uniref:leucine-rich repeat domain-containing protein n=1 Tax=Clostridium perfringens TaxID=1502 RepID=UPI0039E78A98
MKKYKIENLLHSKGYVSIETLIVAGLIIATGAFLISKLVLKGKDVANSNNKNMATAGKTMDDNSFNNDSSIGESTIPGGEDTTNSVAPHEEVDCSLVENPDDLADYEYEEITVHRENIHGIKITKYKGSKKDIIIPSCIDGKKVVEIGECVFGNLKLTSVKLPKYLYSIGEYAFKGNEFTEIDIPDTVKEIGMAGFYRCKLEKIKIPKSMEIIGEDVFGENQLKEVILHNNVKYLYGSPFSGNKIESIIIPDSVIEMSGGFRFNPIKSATLPSWFKPKVSELFDNSSNIKFNYTKHVIPNTGQPPCDLENPDDLDHYKYSVIDDNYINKKVSEYKYENYYKGNLNKWESDYRKKMTQLKGNIVIDKFFPYGKYDIKIPSLIYGRKVVGIDDGAFMDSIFRKEGVKDVVIPNTIKFIGKDAFKEIKLKSLIIPDSVTEIGEHAFSYCKLESVKFGSNLVEIGRGAFSGNNLTSINIPNSVVKMEQNVFYDNEKLKSVIIPKRFESDKNKILGESNQDIIFNFI